MVATLNNDKIATFLSILRCPRSGTTLRIEGEELISETGERYPIINGKPILVRNIQPMHVTPPKANIVSQNVPQYLLPPNIAGTAGFKIHIGSGNVPCADPSVISIDILPCENVDMVAEAEFLPFADNSVVWAVSGAVFEHLYDPLKAIKEVRRVLAAGGSFHIDTAFMQGYHGFPSHYFNMTSQAIETYLLDDFDLVRSYIPPSGSPTYGIENCLRRFVECLPRPERIRLLSMPIGQLLDEFASEQGRKYFYDLLTEHMKRALATSIGIIGKKPDDYENRRKLLLKTTAEEDFAALKRSYYAARVSVIFRYNEIEFYRMRVWEADENIKGPEIGDTLENLLLKSTVEDTLDAKSWKKATTSLIATYDALLIVLDEWIKRFLEPVTKSKNDMLRKQEGRVGRPIAKPY